MKKHFIGLFCLLSILSVTTISWKPAAAKKSGISSNKPFIARELLEKYIDNIYESARLQESGLTFSVFKKALTGFINLKKSYKLPETSSMLTVIDFTKS